MIMRKKRKRQVTERLDAFTVSKALKGSLPAGMYADGKGLYLQVTGSGTASWIYRYKLAGRARYMGLGSLAKVSAAIARKEAVKAREQVGAEQDPIDERTKAKLQKAVASARTMTFKQYCESYIELMKDEWRNVKHASQWKNTFTAHVYPKIGALPVHSIDTTLVLNVLRPIWREKTTTANRIRGRMENVLDAAITEHLLQGPNPARWKDHLEKSLPDPKKIHTIVHHAALPYGEIGAFMEKLAGQSGLAARAFEFLILTATRTSETIGARWPEIDLNTKVWTIPAERTKAEREHRVPLSPPAVAILQSLEAMRDEKHGDFVFPGKNSKPMSNGAILALLKRMARTDITPHGMRSSFRDWVSESTAFPREVAEAALGHVIEDRTEAAYRRGDLFEKRRKMMTAWASYCAKVQPVADNVTQINAAMKA